MNILIVNYEYPPLGGGGGVATKELAEQLAKRHTVHVITSSFKDLPRDEVLAGVHVHRVPVIGRTQLPTATIISMLSFAPTALAIGITLCRQLKFNVINGQFVLPSGFPAAILSKLFHIPFVLSLIGGDLYDPSKGVSPHRHWFLRALIRWIARQAQGITAISHDTKKRALQLHRISKEIVVIPIGLVPKHVAPALRSELGMPKGFVAISIGRLIPRKGYETLIRAWKELEEGSLYIIGAGPLHSKLEKMINEHDLTARVHVVGAVDEKRKHQFLLAADAYVSAASHEGFGIVFLEAMDAGLPIVAPNEGGQTDFLAHEREALLVDSGQPLDIARAISRLAHDVSLRESMSKHNKTVVRNFYIEQTASKFEDILKQAASHESSS